MTARRVVVAGPLVDERPTGAAVHLREVVRALLAERPELQVLARHATARGAAGNRASAARIAPAVRPVTTPVPATALRWAQRRIRFPSERALVGPYDVYHQFHTDCDPAVPARRLVVTLHDTVALDWPTAEGRMSDDAGRLLRRAAAVVTVSEFSRTSICAAFDVDPARVHVVPNGVDHGRFRPGPSPSALVPPGRYLLFTGGHTPRKNVERIVAAFARVHEAHPEVRLVLAGPVAERESQLRHGAPDTLAQDALLFVGYLPDADLPAFYAGADALVHPSLHEGFGLPIVEAMACGTPVVTSDRGAVREVADGAAELVDPTDVAAIAAGIERVLDAAPDDIAAMSRAGVARAAGFSWSAAARRLLAVYDGLAEDSGGPIRR